DGAPYSTRQFTASLLSAGASKRIREVDTRYGVSIGGDVAVADLRRRGRCRPPPAPSQRWRGRNLRISASRAPGPARVPPDKRRTPGRAWRATWAQARAYNA